MQTLVIVESPGKIARLQAIFDGIGPGYRVIATGGHICDLPADWRPTPPEFTPEYVVTDRARDTVQRLRAEVAKADRVILATDPDREGEAMAWHIARVLALQNPLRIEFHSIDADAVRAALTSAHGIHIWRVHAQLARRVLDRVIGYGLGDAILGRLGYSMHFGRVQMPAVRLVVERDREIRAFEPVHHYGVRLHFPGGWSADWWPGATDSSPESLRTDVGLATRLAALQDLEVIDPGNDERQSVPAPAPFDTVALIAAADAELGLSPGETMAAAQNLFEAGAISYHRTDSCQFSAYGKHKLARYCAVAQLPAAVMMGCGVGVAMPGGAHEAIRPNDFAVRDAGNTPVEQRLYRLIWARSVASGMAAGIDAVKRTILRGVEPQSRRKVQFIARRETGVLEGWRAVYKPANCAGGSASETVPAVNPIPILFVPQHVQPMRGEVLDTQTQPPSRFRAATLIAELARRGIGRPSTYINTLSKLADREHRFLKEVDGFLSATSRGNTLVQTLVGASRFIEFDYTRQMEVQLEEVERGRRIYADVVGAGLDQLATDIARLQGNPR